MKTTEQLEFVERLKARMRAFPGEYDQGAFRPRFSMCGQAFCIAGHAYLLLCGSDDGNVLNILAGVDIATEAQNALGLSTGQADVLFADWTAWPYPYREQMADAGISSERVEVACRYLDALMLAE